MKKKLINIFIIFIIVITSSILSCNHIDAKDNYGYSFGCSVNQYEVASIDDNGYFNTISCYSNFDDAKNKMHENDDYVVRNYYNPSPMKIVAMNSGLAFAFPSRYGYSTLSVFEKVSSKGYGGKESYTAPYYSLTYLDTERCFLNNGEGVIYVNLHGFIGYTDLERCDLVPSKFIEEEIPANVYTGKMILRQNYYFAEEYRNYINLYFVSYKAVNSGGYSLNISTQAIDIAPSFMKQNVRYYSPDSINYYSDPRFNNYVGTNYGYYQFLPVRSKTNITAETLKNYLIYVGRSNSAFINQTQAFIDAQNKYGFNALLMFALACNESLYGTDMINDNNIFGLGAFDGAERENAFYYDSISDCVNSFAGYSIAKYCDYWYNSGLDVYNSCVFGNKGTGINLKYASDPYECLTLSAIAFSIDRFSKDYDGTFSDRGTYERALIKNNGVLIKASPSESSNTLYTSYFGYNSTYQKDHVVIVLEKGKEYTKIQTTNSISKDRDIVVMSSGLNSYDFNNSYGYIKTSDLQFIDYKQHLPSKEFISKTVDVKCDENGLYLEGIAYQKNIIDENIVSIYFNDKKVTTFGSLNDEGIFKGYISLNDLDKLDCGVYNVEVKVNYSTYTEFNDSLLIDYLNNLDELVTNLKLISFDYKDDKLLVIVSDKPTFKDILMAVKSFKVDKTNISISGVASISGIDNNKIIKDKFKQYLIVYEYDTNNEYKVEINSHPDASWYNINDGCDYSYGGFEVSFDISKYISGTYGLKMVIEYGDYLYDLSVRSTNKDYSLFLYNNNNTVYKISTNETKLYCFEIEIISSAFEFSINKPNRKESMIDFTNIEIDEKGILNIDGRGFIYGTDFDSISNDKYVIYLLANQKDCYKMDVSLLKDAVDYSDVLGLKNKVENITFRASLDINSINGGIYRIVVVMKSNGYQDIVDLSSRFSETNAKYINDLYEYDFFKSNVKNYIKLKVKEYEK